MGFFVCGMMGRFGLPKEFIMKRLLLIVLPLFISVGYSQKFVHTETFENGNIKSITSHKETRNRIEKVKYVEYYRNGQKLKEETYKGGEKDGLFTEWYYNGQKEYERPFKDGNKDGLYTQWYVSGQKRVEGTYKDGKKDGKWTKWYENGQKKSEEIFKDGKFVSKKEWNEDGSVKE